ncbi:PadR family transcriptional regulator [Pelosinus sp. UFO1]|uniref:PadR family transcriptional regulator n=1 Tax=Pelosinus sp. UFO1 TaxID=484770 RepID=UPI001F46DE4E|nr:PadR family transcriptional regulator [Pelosinus sp. UFO1]
MMTSKSDEYKTGVKIITGLYILKILKNGPAHGNKIATEIKERTQDLLTPNPNALYPLLRRLEEDGYITGEWDNPGTRSKRIYTITDAGSSLILVLEDKVKENFAQRERKIAILREDLQLY